MNTHRVAIVGAGAAGLSAAYAFSKHPDKFIVVVFEKEDVTGGMASSMNIDPNLCGASYINDGVQGCSPAFANTLRIFRELGYPPQKVDMQCAFSTNLHARFYLITSPHFPAVRIDRISFGKGEHFWTNVFPSPLTERFAADIRKFGRVLNTVKFFEVVLALLPIYALLRLFGLSKDFGERMVYPLAALFFGTGNQTPYVASVILVGAPPASPPSFCKRDVDRNAYSRTRVCVYLNMTSVVSLRAFPRCMHSRRSEVVFPRLFGLYITFHPAALGHIYSLATQN
jgi:phytoene dehydrogenase-like protein